MTGPDLIRLAQELAQCGGIHRLTNLVTAAIHVALEHERRGRTVEAWEDGPECGAGMSDKVVRSGAASRPPAGEGDAGGVGGQPSGRGALAGTPDAPASIDLYRAARFLADNLAEQPVCRCGETPLANPVPIAPEPGERRPLPPTHYDPADMLLEDLSKRIRPECRLRTGNALADEACIPPVSSNAGCVSDQADRETRGITHGPGSPIVAEHSGPSDRRVPRFEGKRINPELDGDGA